MIEHIGTIRLFYPMLFLTIGIVLVLLICSVKTVLINFKGQDSESLRLTDTTSKFKDLNHDVLEHALPKEYESELHTLEVVVRELNDKVNYLYEEFLKLKNERK